MELVLVKSNLDKVWKMPQEWSEKDVLSSLNDVLCDEKFLVSPKMSQFLKYVVLETLAGNSDRIKAYTIAVDALGKATTFDPQRDPSIRVMAKRLRDCLEDYYVRTSGHAIVFQLTKGSYAPTFACGNAQQHLRVVQVKLENR